MPRWGGRLWARARPTDQNGGIGDPAVGSRRVGEGHWSRQHTEALTIGIGLAALMDGVVFHQLLQWHHMVSGWHKPDTVANVRTNTTADGWFDLAALVVLVGGISLLWRTAERTGRQPFDQRTTAAVILGAGGFNVVEGLIDHQLLGIHHVREASAATTYDTAFLMASLLICAAGGLLFRRPASERDPVTHP